MTEVIELAEDLIDVVFDAVEIVVDAIETVVDAAIQFVEDHWVEIAIVALIVVIVVTGGFGAVAAEVALYTECMAMSGVVAVETVTLSAVQFVAVIGSSMASFLEVIHFKTLLSIHEIAYILSDDYRQVVSYIYGQIAEVSAALGLGSGYLILLHRNARNVILDVSGMMGRGYDIAEITWLTQYSEYLKVFNKQVNIYKDDPSQILHDVDSYLVKPAADLKGAIVSNIITTIDSTIKVVKETIEDISKLRGDLGQLIHDLPPAIRAVAQPLVDDVFTHYDKWILEEYKPAIRQFDRVLGVFKTEQEAHRSNIASLVDRLKRPADYLLEIDKLDPDVKLQQEEAIADLAFRPYLKEAAIAESDIGPVSFAFQKLVDALKVVTPPPAWVVPEVVIPGRPAGAPVEPRDTWSVGDY